MAPSLVWRSSPFSHLEGGRGVSISHADVRKSSFSLLAKMLVAMAVSILELVLFSASRGFLVCHPPTRLLGKGALLSAGSRGLLWFRPSELHKGTAGRPAAHRLNSPDTPATTPRVISWVMGDFWSVRRARTAARLERTVASPAVTAAARVSSP